MPSMERRTDVRAPVALVGALQRGDDGEAPAMLLDLSSGGVRIQVESPPELDAVYQLRFNLQGAPCSQQVKVVRWTGDEGAYHWGCAFFGLAEEQRARLSRVVRAAAGLGETSVRDWQAVLAEATAEPEGQVVVGTSPAGNDISLSGQDCLEIGREGVELFVQTVAGLETV